MIPFRQLLVEIKRRKNASDKRFFYLTLAVFLVSVAGSLFTDALLPFEGWWMPFRSAILIVISASGFILAYALTLAGGGFMAARNDDWVPLRQKLSPKWRRYISLIVAAFLVVLMYALKFQIGYTLIASAIIIAVIGLFAFMRLTTDEQRREDYDLPDPRDYEYLSKMREFKEEQERKREERERKKAEKRAGRFGKNLNGNKESDITNER